MEKSKFIDLLTSATQEELNKFIEEKGKIKPRMMVCLLSENNNNSNNEK